MTRYNEDRYNSKTHNKKMQDKCKICIAKINLL